MNTLRAENRQGWRVTFLQQICLVVSNMALLFSTIIWYIILPIDELICFKMVKSPPTRNHGHGWFGGTPMAKKTCHFPHFQTPKFAVLRIPRTREKSNGVKSRGKHRSIQLYNSYISINKQVTIRDINGVKWLKSVIILNLLHFWNFLLYLWFEILTTFLRGAISEAAEKWRRLRQPEAIPQNCDVKQRECNFFLLIFFFDFWR